MAFKGCTSLASISIPNSVTAIEDDAFTGCSSLMSITVPDSVTCIDELAFYNCVGLVSIDFKGTKAQWKAISKGIDWNFCTGTYTVHCTDGSLSKNES